MDPQRDTPGVVRRRRYPRKDTDRRYRRTNYVSMGDHPTLADVVTWARENTDVPFEEITLNYATMRWEDDATPAEIASWEADQQDRAARTEAWEREHLSKLLEKYGTPVS